MLSRSIPGRQAPPRNDDKRSTLLTALRRSPARLGTMSVDLPALPAEAVLAPPPDDRAPGGETIGHSRDGRPIAGFRFGRGDLHVSLIGGCHADEPVGPAMLRRLCAYLSRADRGDPLLAGYSWYVVPHVNPDGERRNAAWSEVTVDCLDHAGAPDRGYELPAYVREVVRELPGDDVEFGFPRDSGDREARPENLAVADFLRAGAPFALHGSFHGMDFAPGPWFLIEPAWIDRTGALRDNLRRRVRALGYSLYDVDRGGEKGFFRIDEGFTTRPDSKAMRAYFEQRGDERTAARFRPSSMEHVRSLGGDPFTFVSEMPLFLLAPDHELPAPPKGPEARLKFHQWVERLVAEHGTDGARREADRLGLTPMPIRDQMRLQLAFLEEGLAATAARAPGRRSPLA